VFESTFDPSSLRDFDGRSWGSARLEDTTRDEFKRTYRTRGGKFVRPEALIVTPPSGALWEAQALFDGTDGRARLTGFYLTFKDDGVRLDRLEDGALSSGDKWYAEPRFSDWYVLADSRDGTALMVVSDGDDRVPAALLTTPSRLGRVLDRMKRDQTRVEDIRDKFDRLDKTVEVGTVAVLLNRKDVRPRNEELVLGALRLRAPREIENDAIRYSRNGRGSVTISFNIVCRDGDRDNHVDATATLVGSNERGRITETGFGRAPLDRDERRASRDVDYAIQNAYMIALNSLRSQVARKVRDQKPPSPREYRADVFVSLFDGATR
jgi:hypothetical protein